MTARSRPIQPFSSCPMPSVFPRPVPYPSIEIEYRCHSPLNRWEHFERMTFPVGIHPAGGLLLESDPMGHEPMVWPNGSPERNHQRIHSFEFTLLFLDVLGHSGRRSAGLGSASTLSILLPITCTSIDGVHHHAAGLYYGAHMVDPRRASWSYPR